jgi:hypothetical protein
MVFLSQCQRGELRSIANQDAISLVSLVIVRNLSFLFAFLELNKLFVFKFKSRLILVFYRRTRELILHVMNVRKDTLVAEIVEQSPFWISIFLNDLRNTQKQFRLAWRSRQYFLIIWFRRRSVIKL